jgi:hypothetical protein
MSNVFYSTQFRISLNQLSPRAPRWLGALDEVTFDGEQLHTLLTTPTMARAFRNGAVTEDKRLRLIAESKQAPTEAKQKAAKKQLDGLKAQGGYVVLGASGTGRRLAADMTVVSCVGLDIDEGALSERTLRGKLEASGLTAIYCSTFKSVEGGERWRVVVPLAHEVTADAIKQQAMIDELAERLKIPPDPQAKDTSRLFYLPVMCESGRVISGIVEGQLFDASEAEHREPAIKAREKRSGRLSAILDGSDDEQAAWLNNARSFEWVSSKNKDDSLDMRTVPRTVQTNIANSAEANGRDRDMLFQGFITACLGAVVWNPDEIEAILERLEKDNHPVGQKWGIYKDKDPMRQLTRAMIKAANYLREQSLGDAVIPLVQVVNGGDCEKDAPPAFMLRNRPKGE